MKIRKHSHPKPSSTLSLSKSLKQIQEFPKTCKNFSDLRNFAIVFTILFWVHITLKSSANTYTSTFIYHLYLVKETCPKRKQRKRYKEEKRGRSIFGKTSFLVLFALGLGLITPYSFDVLIWYFYQTFLIVCNELWLRFEPQIRSIRFAMNFLFIIATTKRKVHLCETVLSFSNWILVCLSWNLSCFVPNYVSILP